MFRSCWKTGCQAIVLSRGMLRRLQTCQETLDLLESQGILQCMWRKPREAVAIYNDLAERETSCRWPVPLNLLMASRPNACIKSTNARL